MRHITLALLLIICSVCSAHVAAQESSTARFSVKSYAVDGENPLTDAETRSVLDLYLGEHDGVAGLKAAAAALNRRFAEKGFPTRRAIVPAQTLSNGIARLQIVAFTVGTITVEGNAHYSTDNILASIPALQLGTDLDGNALSRQLSLANEHPTKSLQLQVKEAAAARQIEATVKVEDERPYNLFAIVSNRGSESTPASRLLLGAQHSNLFGRDHVVTATYTTSPEDLSAVKQYGLNYRVPFYRFGAVISGYFVKSDVDSGQVAGVLNVNSAGRFMGVRVRHNLQRLGTFTHALSAGIDDKLFESRVSFGRTTIPTDVRSRPVSFGYDGEYRFADGTTRFYASYVQNLPVGPDTDSLDYARARIGAEPDWNLLRFGGAFEYSLPRGWAVQGRLDAQIAAEPLIPGEQFGVGGVGSVRGYDERMVAGDNGFAASLELWSPPLAYGIRGLGFIDMGSSKNSAIFGVEADSDNLSAAGVGLRWAWQRQVSVSADVAWPLRTVRSVNRGHPAAHVELVLRY